MEHLRSYDEWKCRAPDPGGGAGDPQSGYNRTRMLWWRTYRLTRRHGNNAAWLDTQRALPAPVDAWVREADLLNARHDDERT